MQKVRFAVGGVDLVGDLRTFGSGRPRAAVAIIGPMTFCKEQAPTQYAERLHERGFVTLAYDSRYRGESGGEPRCWENPAAKVEDLTAAINYLRNRDDVAPGQVSVLAICQGSSAALPAAQAAGAASLVTIAGHYRDELGDIEWLGSEGRESRLERGRAAKDRFAQSGEVQYVRGVDETDMDVGMPGAFVWEWYQPWADRGIWENRYAVMSDADLLQFESISAARSLTVPWLMIHGDNCFLPGAARRHIEAVPSSTRTRTVWDDAPHLSYYDQPDAIDRAVTHASEWFGARA